VEIVNVAGRLKAFQLLVQDSITVHHGNKLVFKLCYLSLLLVDSLL
jgi:hypothetical protein